MKLPLHILTGLSLICIIPTAQADIMLGAPGITAGTRIATKVPFKIDYTITNTYKFIFSGIEAKGDTLGAPGSSGTNGNGGQFNLKASVKLGNASGERAGNLYFRNIQEYNSSPLKTLLITPSAEFKATTTPINVDVTWQGGGNAHKPNGIFNILGEHQKDPPIPTGSLSFITGNWILEDSPNPQGTATVTRE